MKKTQFIDLITTIRQTAVSFIAVTVFIALGLAFYGGITWSAQQSQDSLNRTYQDGYMRTLLVTDPLGLSDNQISELKTIDGIDDAEGLNIVYRFFDNKSGVKQQAAVVQMTERIDRLMNVEGQLPVEAGQAAVLRSWAEENDVAIGDVITLDGDNAVDYRAFRSVRSLADWDGTDIDYLNGINDDKDCMANTSLKVTAIVDSPVYLSTNPYAHGICSSNGLYIDAVFFVTGEELEGCGSYTSAALYSEELSRTDCFSDEYKSRSKALSEKVQEKVDRWDSLLVDDFSESVENYRTLLDAISIQTGANAAGGEVMYEYLSQMKEELGDQEVFSAVTETDANSSFLTADNLIGVLVSLRGMLGITFLAIAVLICYSVLSRLVADSSVLIGTRKALGFHGREIQRLYLYYVGAALLLSGVFGTLLGVFGIEYAFVEVFASQFTFTRIPLICNLMDVLPVFLIICAILIVITIVACSGETGKRPVDLLKRSFNSDESNNVIKDSRIIKKLSLLNQTVVRNLFRDKRRVFGMIIGIAGSAALMTAGLTFYANFSNAFAKQFEDYYTFDYQICYDASSETASEEIKDILDSHELDYAEFYSSTFVLYTPDGKTNAPNVIVPTDTEKLSKLMHFDTDSEKAAAYDDGLWMSEYYRYAFDAGTGSRLKLKTLSGIEAQIPVKEYYKQHLSTPVIVMDEKTYADAFGEKPRPNAFYVSSGGIDMEQLDEELKVVEGYIYIYNFYESFLASFSSEEMVVMAFSVMFGLMSVLMALMTIVNLLNIYISEKKDELIILMINGYDRKFAKKYIYQDTIILTVAGILVGLAAGCVLGDRALIALEGTSVRLIHGINYASCAIAAAATAGLTALVCLMTLRRVDSFRLSDIVIGR